MEKVNTEEKELRTRVLVGLSGGKNSFMAAYLLKIQKYEVLAATIVQDSNLEVKCSVTASELEEIKDFCHKLGIPHYTIEGNESFLENVQEKWISSQIEKLPWSSRCTGCQINRLELLFQKMIELDAEFMSTGHFGKIIKTDTDQFHIHSVHDLKIDQSYILHKLSPEILSRMLLPLASMGTIELEKLSEHFSLTRYTSKEMTCFSGPISNKLLESYSSLIEPSTVEVEKPSTYSSREVPPQSTQLKLNKVKWSFGMKKGAPFKGFVYFNGQSLEVTVFPKTLSSLWLECEKELDFIPGQEIEIFQKKGGGAKLLLSGVISLKTLTPIGEEAPIDWSF